MTGERDEPRCRLVIERHEQETGDLEVCIEPRGEAHVVKPGDVLRVYPSGSASGYFHQVLQGRQLLLYFEGDYDYPRLVLNGSDVTGSS